MREKKELIKCSRKTREESEKRKMHQAKRLVCYDCGCERKARCKCSPISLGLGFICKMLFAQNE